ncbi:MAG TPA: pseudouridine synthase [Sphingobium sp.]
MAPPPKAPSSNRPRSGGPRRPRSDGPARDGEKGGRSNRQPDRESKSRDDKRPPRAGKPDRASDPRASRSGEQRPSRTGPSSGKPRPPRTEESERRGSSRATARSAEPRAPRDASERSGKPRAKARSTDTRPPRDASERHGERSAPRTTSRSGEQRAPRATFDAPGKPADRPHSDTPGRPRFTGRTERPGAPRDTYRTDDPSRSRPVSTPRFGKPKAAPSVRSPDRPDGDRIAKLLARAGIASRRDIERMIEEGRIALNGTVIETPATILTSLHGITVDGELVKEAAPARLFLFHKPGGCLTAERDPAGRTTIYDRLPTDMDLPRLMPVGRLDYNTEGLLLLTNDGELKRLLELPSTGVPRTYRARAFGEISQDQLEELVMGIEIDGMKYGRIDANLERRTGRNTWIEMTLTEGKNREVRRVLEHFGLEVSRLIRTAYGPFVLGDSVPGAIEEVRRHDLIVFRSSLEKATAKKPEKKGEE